VWADLRDRAKTLADNLGYNSDGDVDVKTLIDNMDKTTDDFDAKEATNFMVGNYLDYIYTTARDTTKLSQTLVDYLFVAQTYLGGDRKVLCDKGCAS